MINKKAAVGASKTAGLKKVVKRKPTAPATAAPPRGARSEAIRGYLSRNPGASPKEVVVGLKAGGIEVSEGLVASIKYDKRHKAVGRKQSTRPTPEAQGAALSVGDLLEAKRLADELEGIEQVRQALEALERLR